MPMPTLIQDLEHAAELAHFAAVHAGTLPSAAEARFRTAAERLRNAIDVGEAEPGHEARPWWKGWLDALYAINDPSHEPALPVNGGPIGTFTGERLPGGGFALFAPETCDVCGEIEPCKHSTPHVAPSSGIEALPTPARSGVTEDAKNSGTPSAPRVARLKPDEMHSIVWCALWRTLGVGVDDVERDRAARVIANDILSKQDTREGEAVQAPASPSPCAPWCGQCQAPVAFAFSRGVRDYCTEACAVAGRPLNPPETAKPCATCFDGKLEFKQGCPTCRGPETGGK